MYKVYFNCVLIGLYLIGIFTLNKLQIVVWSMHLYHKIQTTNELLKHSVKPFAVNSIQSRWKASPKSSENLVTISYVIYDLWNSKTVLALGNFRSWNKPKLLILIHVYCENIISEQFLSCSKMKTIIFERDYSWRVCKICNANMLPEYTGSIFDSSKFSARNVRKQRGNFAE